MNSASFVYIISRMLKSRCSRTGLELHALPLASSNSCLKILASPEACSLYGVLRTMYKVYRKNIKDANYYLSIVEYGELRTQSMLGLDTYWYRESKSIRPSHPIPYSVEGGFKKKQYAQLTRKSNMNPPKDKTQIASLSSSFPFSPPSLFSPQLNE